MTSRITRTSILTNVTRTMEFSKYDQDEFDKRYIAYKKGMLIQDAFPDLSNDAREFIISGITKEEWELEYGE